MILRTIFIFVLLLGSVYIGTHLQRDPGYLLLVVHHWIIETSLWVALGLLIATVVIVHLAMITLQKIVHIPRTWQHWRSMRRAQKAQAKTRQGLIEFSEGHWQQAKKNLINALPDADTPLLNYLTAARAAEEMGDHTLRDDYLRQAQQSMPEAKIAVELTQAQLQLANQQWERALATLKHLQDLVPHHPYVLKLLMRLYEDIGDWQQLIDLLPTLKRVQVISKDTFTELQHRAYLQSLLNMIKDEITTRPNQEQAITQLIDSLPKELKYDSAIVGAYAEYLIKQHQDKQAEVLLHRCLQKECHEELIILYSEMNPEEVKLEFIESLLKKAPHSAALNLCLGRIGISKQLWAKARGYLETSIQLKPTPAAYLQLGELLEQLNDQTGACQTYKKGLRLLTHPFK